jgi:hypothetical protein
LRNITKPTIVAIVNTTAEKTPMKKKTPSSSGDGRYVTSSRRILTQNAATILWLPARIISAFLNAFRVTSVPSGHGIY